MNIDDLQVAALERAMSLTIAPTVDVPRNQPRPTYDEKTDGNRFAWILKAAHQVRVQELATNETRRIRLAIARRCALPVLVERSDAK